MDLRDYIGASIEADRIRLSHYRKVMRTKADGVLKCRLDKRTGKKEYYIKLPGEKQYHYAGKKYNKLVVAIQLMRFAEKYVRVLEHNIRCKRQFLIDLQSDDPEDINSSLSPAYRTDPAFSKAAGGRNRKIKQSENPYKREELNIETSFGLFVRTKGELVIAEILYSLNIRFFYEKALELTVIRYDDTGVPYETTKQYYPDFTIILGNGMTIYWEHKGMMKYRDYVERDIRKEVDYNLNGIFQSHNLIVTSEGPDNDIDMDGIMRIITGWLMPLMSL